MERTLLQASYWEVAPLIIGLKNQVKSELAEFGTLSTARFRHCNFSTSYRLERATNALLD